MTLTISPAVEQIQHDMTLTISPAVEQIQSDADTILVYLIDRSGSMHSCWEETISGLNSDITVQKDEDDGKTDAVVYFFSGTGYGRSQTNMVKPFDGKLTEAIQFEERNREYSPNGSTPLYDAVGVMIAEIKRRIDASPIKPNVLVSIFTDGGNTDNHGYDQSAVKGMVEACQGDGWTFTYFGANQDAWAVGGSFGIAKGNTMSYNTDNMKGLMATASVARSAHTRMAKTAFNSGDAYSSTMFFADAGQTSADYNSDVDCNAGLPK